MVSKVTPANLDRDALRDGIQGKYSEVAEAPETGFHSHTGRPLAQMLGYDDADIDWLPAATVESFAGTGNPLSGGRLPTGATILDVGCGAGFDTLLAARQVGPTGAVIAVDMTEAMREKTQASADALGLANVETREGFAEDLPVDDSSIDIIISNGVVNLCPDKMAVLKEMGRVLKPGGYLQIADIVVQHMVPQDAKDDIDLWSG
ncbi:MAG TPA: methyltransferase domain-containing protein [Dehalococcoidia bacterium]|nr:methyltransferase domain-containing protein [Dehalococcoidia bacterium]